MKKIRLRPGCGLRLMSTPYGVIGTEWTEVADVVHVYKEMEVFGEKPKVPEPVKEEPKSVEPKVVVPKVEKPKPKKKLVKKQVKKKRTSKKKSSRRFLGSLRG